MQVALAVASNSSGGSNGSAGATAFFSSNVGLVPGSGEVRQIHLTNTGTLTASYTLSTVGGSGLLWDDHMNGLQMAVVNGATPVYRGPLAATDLPLDLVLEPGQSADLTLTIALPPNAGNQYQDRSTTVAFVLTATAW